MLPSIYIVIMATLSMFSIKAESDLRVLTGSKSYWHPESGLAALDLKCASAGASFGVMWRSNYPTESLRSHVWSQPAALWYLCTCAGHGFCSCAKFHPPWNVGANPLSSNLQGVVSDLGHAHFEASKCSAWCQKEVGIISTANLDQYLVDHEPDEHLKW